MASEPDITSDFSELEDKDLKGDRVAVGFRPSGELHVGNLLTLTYSAVLADELDLELELICCDTDWSAHLHGHHKPESSEVMKLFFQRECPCGEHDNIAEHRVDEIHPFLEGLEEELGVEIDPSYLTDLEGDEKYMEALREVLTNMDELDDVFGGGFRRRYDSPVVNVCPSCGFSRSKGAAYSENTDELVFSCRNPECNRGFAAGNLSEEIGVYYLVDPVRDPGRNVAVHVFGGDYRNAEKEMKTPKIEKVAKITKLANSETPAYFLAPLIADNEGKPLSKSKGTGKTVSEIKDLKHYARDLALEVKKWIKEEKKFLPESKLN
jgi:lysyl-tRNA synthetase class I